MNLKKISLKQEIFLLLTIKLILLYFLWLLCFSHPIDKNLHVPIIAQHLFNRP